MSLTSSCFSHPKPGLISLWKPELIDWWGKELNTRVLRFQDKHWFVKFKRDSGELKRDYLAYLLGKDWTNIAQVRTLNECEFHNLSDVGILTPEWASPANTFLVRLGQDYKVDQLCDININEAVANELVFSLWIRRRDTHSANHIYINNIPVFFDHQTAFLGEARLMDLEAFFQPGDDAGYAGRWRVEVVKSKMTLSTVKARRTGKSRGLAVHYVTDRKCFNNYIQNAVEHLQCQNSKKWFRAAQTAGFNEREASEINKFLKNNCVELGAATEKMRTVIFQQSNLKNIVKYISRIK